MRETRRRGARTSTILMLTLVLLGIATVASAQDQICINLNDLTQSMLYRLTVTRPGNGAATVVGTVIQAGSARRVVTGGGALVGGQFAMDLHSSDITVSSAGDDRTLVTDTTHVRLNGLEFTSGTFEAAHVQHTQTGQGFGQSVSFSDGGTATVVLCPPQG